MSKFKAGDVVRRVIAPNYGTRPQPWTLEVGAVRVVWEVDSHRNWIRLISKGVPEKECHDCEYFELVSRATAALSPTYAPNVRPNDPATSHVAAISIKPKKLSIKASILDLLEKHREGLTGQEIAEHTGHRLNSITPRFAELNRGLRLFNSGDVRNGQIVWVL